MGYKWSFVGDGWRLLGLRYRNIVAGWERNGVMHGSRDEILRGCWREGDIFKRNN